MLKRIRQFFWTSIVGGMLFMFSAFSYAPSQNSGQNNSLLQLVKQGATQVLKQYNKSVQSVCENCKVNVPNPNSQQIIPEKKYVLISGKYFPYREDHIYFVNGEKIYYRDESHWYDENGVKHEKLLAKTTASPAKGGVEVPSAVGVYSPENLKNMADTLEQAKENMQMQSQTLEALDAEDKRFQKTKSQ